MNRTILTLSLLAVAACKKEAALPAAVPPPPPPPVAAAPLPSPVVAELKANFQRVQFNFDSADLDEDGKHALAANASILRRHPELQVEVQGHADERGTTDYNLALGQRRAQAIVDTLTRSGVSPKQVKTLSYGEERPADPAHSEVAWSRNRRGEFRVTWGVELALGTVED